MTTSHCSLSMKGSGSSGAKKTDARLPPAKRAGGDAMMYVVVSSTRKLIKPRACLFHHFNRKPQLKQRLERILMHSCVASHAYCKCLFKPRTSLQKDAGLGSVSQQTQFSVPQIACALSHPSTAHLPGSPRKLLCCTPRSVGRLSLRWLSLPIPLGSLEELAGQWRNGSCSRSYWILVNGAVRACVAVQILPMSFSLTKESGRSKYQICRCPLAWLLGDSIESPSIGHWSPSPQVSKICEQSVKIFLCHWQKATLVLTISQLLCSS